MLRSPRARKSLLLGAVVAAMVLVAGCGVESEVKDAGGKPGDPAPAVHALRLYLDHDRCDLLSARMLLAIDPEPGKGRKLCDAGEIPVDALVRRGQYTIKDAELIDGDGVIRVELKDGGIRDYTLVPGGPEGFLVDQLKTTTVAEYGDALRFQGREAPGAEPVDARIRVISLRRVYQSELSSDEYVNSMDHYYLLKVSLTSRSRKKQLLGSDGFQLATKDGYVVSSPRDMYTDLGRPLPGVLKPGETNTGYLFFTVPEQRAAIPKQVRFAYGEQYVGDTLVWNQPPK
ncbi:MAG: hypothetical protein PGN13_11585 [Patulibacter minatonensis]